MKIPSYFSYLYVINAIWLMSIELSFIASSIYAISLSSQIKFFEGLSEIYCFSYCFLLVCSGFGLGFLIIDDLVCPNFVANGFYMAYTVARGSFIVLLSIFLSFASLRFIASSVLFFLLILYFLLSPKDSAVFRWISSGRFLLTFFWCWSIWRSNKTCS